MVERGPEKAGVGGSIPSLGILVCTFCADFYVQGSLMDLLIPPVGLALLPETNICQDGAPLDCSKRHLLEVRLEMMSRNPSRNPCFWTENSGHLKLVYDDAALPSKPNGVCCNKKYGSRIQEIQRSARKPFCASFWAYVGVNRACITGSPGFMASFCLR